MALPPNADREALLTYPHVGGEVFAALDLGTNNCRLLVARVQPHPETGHPTSKVIDSFSRIIRLGEGVSQSGELTQDAMDRAFQALEICKSKLDRHPITAGRYVATEACRRAKNSAEFLQKVERHLGIPIDIITTEEEAQLAFTGCATLLTDDADHALVFDIGGGSTELLWVACPPGKTPQVLDWFSLPYGVMNLSEAFGGPQFADLYFADMVTHLREKLAVFDQKNRIAERIAQAPVQLLSTSGTVTTLAAVHLGLPRYDRNVVDGIRLPSDAVDNAGLKLLRMRPSERFHEPCVGAERSDFILYGYAIFAAIYGIWPASRITIADRGVREGIIVSFMKGL